MVESNKKVNKNKPNISKLARYTIQRQLATLMFQVDLHHIYIILRYQKNVQIMMVNNSTIINKANYHLWP
jgi:hypothetical protein